MNTEVTRATRGVSVMSIVFGILGAAFWWWVPLGMVLGMAGLTAGIVDCILARRRSLTYRLAIIGVLISIAALALDFTLAGLGMQVVTLVNGS